MKRDFLIALSLYGLTGAAMAEQPGWFLEAPADEHVLESNAWLLLPIKQPGLQNDRQYALNFRAGFRFSEAFTLSAGLDEYLLNNTRGQFCAASDFVCQASRERLIDYGTAYTVSLAPAIRLDEELSIYGHLGVQGWNVESGADAVSSRELLFGIGVGYDISNPFRLQLEYRSMDLDIKLTSIGFTWRF